MYMPPRAPSESARLPAVVPRKAKNSSPACTHCGVLPCTPHGGDAGRVERQRRAALHLADRLVQVDQPGAGQRPLGRGVPEALAQAAHHGLLERIGRRPGSRGRPLR